MKPLRIIPQELTRRAFIRQAACAAIGTAALSATVRDLRFLNSAMAQTAPITDYKALVCVFLSGGNDSNNLIVPTLTAEYAAYAAIRTPALALPQAGLLPISPLNNDGHTYALHPACPELQTLFGESKLALLFNTGTLVFPMTRAQYLAGVLSKPQQLFSHHDQVVQWQTSIPDRPSTTGWGGRCADLMAAVLPSAPISLSVSVAGANTFEVGQLVSPYAVTPNGAITLLESSSPRLQAIQNILGLPHADLQTQAYARVVDNAMNMSSLLTGAIQPTAAANYWTVPFPASITTPTSGTTFTSALGPQLQMIARLIEAGNRGAANGGFGMKRQIFFCHVGGYDLHANQTPGPGSTATGAHANLLAELSQSLLAFQRAMEQLGLSNNVTAFTASDFGRTLVCNGLGSDHGWGGHHLILGGAVQGQRTYGTFPALAVNGPDDSGYGRWIPTTAIDQYFSTLASWFGVDSGNLDSVFPNLDRFSSPNLGFV